MNEPAARIYVIDLATGREMTEHPLNGSPNYGLGAWLDEKGVGLDRAPASSPAKVYGLPARHTLLAKDRTLTVADFGGKPVGIKRWSPEPALCEKFYLVPEGVQWVPLIRSALVGGAS